MIRSHPIHDQQGFVLVTVMWILLLLVFLGMGAMNRSSTEMLIAGNDKFHQTAFYAAEAARGFIQQRTDFYGDTNTALGEGVDVDEQNLGDARYEAYVEYLEAKAGRRSTGGSQVISSTGGGGSGGFQEHHYRMDCTGTAVSKNSTTSRVSARFYRIGY